MLVLSRWCLASCLSIGVGAVACPTTGQAPAPAAAALRVYGTFVQQVDDLERPTMVVASPRGGWAVLERDARRVRLLAADGVERLRIEGEGSGAGSSTWHLALGAGPRAIAFDRDGRLTLLAPDRMAVVDVDGGDGGTSASAGVPWRVVSGLDLGEPAAAAWKDVAGATGAAGRELWIADRRGCVLVLDGDGALLRRLTGGPAGFLRPSGIAIAGDGSVFVADEDADAIVHLDGAGSEIGRFGERGSFPGLFNAPQGLAVAGDALYVTDELNHRITIHSFDGTFRSFWGMHAVVPREGEGKIHYPTSVAISADGLSACVAEPLERRVQRFGPSDPEAAMNAPMPAREGVMSHFGGAIASDGELLLLEEPESSSVFLFDLRDPTPIHVTTFGGAGPGPDRFGRISALFVDASTQRALVADVGHRRLGEFHLARDRSAPLRLDPFLATLRRSWDLVAWSDRVRALVGAAFDGVLEPVGFVRRDGALWTIDRRHGLLVELDEQLAPKRAVATGLVGAAGLALVGDGPTARFATTLPDEGTVVLVDDAGTVLARATGRTTDGDLGFVRPNAVARMPDGSLVVTDAGRDAVFVVGADLAVTRRIGQRGASDGDLWMPQGVLPYAGAPTMHSDEDGVPSPVAGPRFVVVDRGNHRAQIFQPDGTWLMTFGLGRSYTRPRERGAT